VLTWVAVVHDVLAKLDELAVAGDQKAEQRMQAFRQAVLRGDLSASLDFKRKILELARDEFELFGTLAYKDLRRLQEDRNRCAHPAMIDDELDYQPPPELARCHVVNAVEHLLRQAPIRGKAALNRLQSDLDRTYFPESVESLADHLSHGPLANHARVCCDPNIDYLLKQALLETAPPGGTTFERLRAAQARREVVARCLRTVQAVAALHRPRALPILHGKLRSVLARVDDARLGEVLTLVANIDGSWEQLPSPQSERLKLYVERMPKSHLNPVMNYAWRIAALRNACDKRLARMRTEDWEAIAAIPNPPTEWIQQAVDAMCARGSFAAVNACTSFLEHCISMVTAEQIDLIFSAVRSNGQVSHSSGLRTILSALVKEARVDVRRARELVKEACNAASYEAEPWWTAEPANNG
jgi:hypothetical protein